MLLLTIHIWLFRRYGQQEFLTTEAVVADKPEEGGAPAMPDMGGMGGMGGMM
nr:hypothetical protein [Priestia aryabhattai]